MSFIHPSIQAHRRARPPMTVHYFTVYVNTNMNGYHAAVHRAVFAMNTKSTDWADDALTAMDMGWAWGAKWTDEKWHVQITQEDMYAGIYRIRVMTDYPHSWVIIARSLKNEINKRGAHLAVTYRSFYVQRITAEPPVLWPNQAIPAFQLSQVKKRGRKFRRDTN